MAHFGIIALIYILITIKCYCFAGSVFVSNNHINCDGLICPEGTNKCVAIERTTNDLKSIRYIRECYNGNGEILIRDEKTKRNPFPGNSVNNYSQVFGGYGNQNVIIQSNGANNNIDSEEVRKIVENAERQAENAERQAREQTEYWAKWQKDFQENLRRNQAVNAQHQAEYWAKWQNDFQENLRKSLQF